MPTMLTTPTAITTLDRVDFVGSPKHLIITGTTFNSVTLLLWVWSGDLLSPYTGNAQPTIILKKTKVSFSDDFIQLSIADLINPYINQKIEFNALTSNVSGEGVFYQYEVYQYNITGSGQTLINTLTPPTRFATGGYNWNYESEGTFTYNRGSLGFVDTDVKKYYSPYLRYFDGKINLSGATTSNGMVVREPAQYNTNDEKCASDPYVIVYLNKMGLWDTFTPTGKVVISNKIDRQKYSRQFRKVTDFNPKYDHETVQYNINGKNSYNINTGNLTPEMTQLIQEILLSSKIYLIKFSGKLSNTVDSTIITVDSTIITVDTTSNYSEYNSIPVVVTTSDFTYKNKLNDRNKINYNIVFDEAQTIINNIR